VGCVAALAFARRGARVLLLEANPSSSKRFAGEWVHPPAVAILRDLGVDLKPSAPFASGRGFVVYPDDGSRPVVLPYATGSFGYSFEHGALVGTLRGHCEANSLIDYVPHARATQIEGQRLTYQVESGRAHEVRPQQIVGASGRSSVVHAALGVEKNSGTYSRMAGLVLEDAELPFEGYGHVCLGGLGPVLAYRIDARRIRLCIDVPLSLRIRRDKEAVLYEAYASAMPENMRPAFRAALFNGSLAWATNQIRPRVEFGREGLALVGDAVGYHHPLTALGMTLGFQDAVALSKAKSFPSYRRERILRSRVPEMLAVALYEVFADTSDEVVAIRHAIYDLWRNDSAERFRTMRFLGCQDTNPLAFGSSFSKSMLLAGRELGRHGLATGRWDHARQVTRELSSRIRWLLGGALHLTPATPTKSLPRSSSQRDSAKAAPNPHVALSADERYGAALRASSAKAAVVEHPSLSRQISRIGQGRPEPALALERATRALTALQADDGSWEGEVVWCPMLAAQYVLACHLMDRPIDPERRRRFLLHFERTRLPDGTWGLHDFMTEPYLFVTTLVYVAARVLGVAPNDPLISRGLEFIRAEGGAVSIPSWGKFWLATLNLYAWDGVNPVLPEIWGLPRWMPVHPSRYYCHTRLIYLAMATIFGERYQTPRTPLVDALRNELYPQGYDAVDFRAARTSLREKELFAPPSPILRAMYRALTWVDRYQSPERRRAAVDLLRERIRFELRTTNFTNISPVSGLLNIVALHIADPCDPDAQKAFESMDGWIWEDDTDGARVAGARSASWDTGFAAQALAVASEHVDVHAAIVRADAFLASQQIDESWPEARAFDRIDPRGGYCFAGVWHGWPVSDCTAEALLGRLASPYTRPTEEQMAMGVRFLVQCQNFDGGFSTYEPRRLRFSLEWMNPAEMFGDSMTEFSFVECTASCVSAIVMALARFPDLRGRSELPDLDGVIARGIRFMRDAQHPQGSWPGAWGVRLVYGTMFGIRGLIGAGVPPTDPAIRKACAWLKSHQRADGSWSEMYSTHEPTQYVDGDEGQVTQTAWALSALLEAHDPDWDVVDRAARFLASMQLSSGEWPRENPAGVFFHTALLDYVLYKSYFPLWALAQYETRRKEREGLADNLDLEQPAAE
jgi:lanosterol synthase